MGIIPEMIAIYRGNTKIRTKTSQLSCGSTAENDACAYKTILGSGNVCLYCIPDYPSIHWYVHATKKSIVCSSPSSEVTSTVFKNPVSEIPYVKDLERPCGYGETISPNVCVVCPASCGGSCRPNGVCLSCDWHSKEVLNDAGQCDLGSCPIVDYFNGECNNCSAEGGCLSCNLGKCGTCENGKQPFLGLCCDTLNGFYLKSNHNGNPSCQQCHHSCHSCDGPTGLNCLTCASGTFDIDGYCPNGRCNLNEHYNPENQSCQSCPLNKVEVINPDNTSKN